MPHLMQDDAFQRAVGLHLAEIESIEFHESPCRQPVRQEVRRCGLPQYVSLRPAATIDVDPAGLDNQGPDDLPVDPDARKISDHDLCPTIGRALKRSLLSGVQAFDEANLN